MTKTIARRDLLKMGMTMAACTTVGMLTNASPAAAQGEPLFKAGIITDMHKTPKADTDTRKYSGSIKKMQTFLQKMEELKPAFIIELGDFVDTLTPETNPAQNLAEIEQLFTSYSGGHYHVLGNHDFDNLKRPQFLNAVTNTNIPQGQTWYSWNTNGVHCIVLDADYTPTTFRPYDMNTPEDTFWTWTDTIIPPQELEWLKADLEQNTLPTLVFTHQTLDRVDSQDHNIKNAAAVREILEQSGHVLAVISGHDHQGGYSNIKGIHYLVMNGNVGVNDTRPWAATSNENGLGLQNDNQFALLEIYKNQNAYQLKLTGYGRQPSYCLERTL